MKRKEQTLTRLFHYTVGIHLQSIFLDKIIKVASACVVGNEKAAVWLTYSPDWENTANKSRMEFRDGDWVRIIQNKEETEANCGGLFRIEIKPDKYKCDWKDFKNLSGIDGQIAKFLYGVAITEGSRIGLWRFSFDPIPIDDWICLETWDVKEWVKVDCEEYLVSGCESGSVAA